MGPRATGRTGRRCARPSLCTALLIGVLGWLLPGTIVGVPAEAWADQELAVTIKDHRFDPPEVRAKAGEKILLKVTNEDDAPEEFESSALNREQLIRPKHTVTIHLPALQPGQYDFYGEFNPKTAMGQLIIEELK
jgi:plastocyanin